MDDLSEINETTLGLSTCILVGCPDILTFRLAEQARYPRDVTATGPSHADSEYHQAYIEGPALKIEHICLTGNALIYSAP